MLKEFTEKNLRRPLWSRPSVAQTLYSENFDVDPTANWTVLQGGGTDSFVDFHFDYGAALGIPSAPNSGGTTRGMRFLVNQTDGVFQGITAYPASQGFTGNYRLRFDMWLNYVGPLGPGGSGSTQCGSFGVGATGNSAMWAGGAPAGVMFAATTDGNSADDYRCYSNSVHLAATSGAYVANSRNQSAAYYTTNFPSQSAPAAQTALFAEQTGTTLAGSLGFAWRDVVIEKIDNTVTWTVDGKLIATSGTPASFSTNIFFGAFDINATSSTSINDFLNAAIFDNVRVESLGNAVSVSEAGPVTEGGSSDFTFTRSGSTASELTVNFTVGGSATSGSDYTAFPSTVTFAAGESTTNITVLTTDDSVAESTETIVLTITSSPNYGIGTGIATLSIVDNEPATLSISATQPTCYESVPDDYVTFRVTRLGSTAEEVTANLSFSGTASDGVDYATPAGTVTLAAGTNTATFTVSVIDDSELESDETIICTVVAGTGYDVGAPNSATGTILENEVGTEDVIFADSFENDTSADWQVRFASNNGIDDYLALFGYDYSFDGIPTAPGATASTALKLTVNKFDATSSGAAGVNVYPLTNTVSGDYAVRGQVYLKLGNVSTTEQGLFGINHSGDKVNWFRESSGNVTVPFVDADGLWYVVYQDASENHLNYTGNGPSNPPLLLDSRAPSTLSGVFKQPPHTLAGGPNNQWADFEIKQVGDVVTFSLNRTVIFSTNNTTPYTSGKIMLGYNDSYDSIGGSAAAAYFHNLRVVRLESTTPPTITYTHSGGSLTLNWTGSGFTLEEASSLSGPWTGVATSSGHVVGTGSGTKFYRLVK